MLLYMGSISLTQQLDYYSLVHDQLVQQLGSTPAQTHLANSLFLVVIGSNDLLDYFNKDSNVSKKYTPSQYVHLMASTLKQFIKRLYGLGARKFVVIGVGVIGCCPEQRMQNNDTSRCNEEANYWSTKYNIRLKSLLKELKLESHDLTHSYFATYRAMNALIRDPQSYGIVEIKEACCGLGTLNADMPCLPISNVCSNRSDYLFWDLYHPTEMVSHMFADLIYQGSPRFTLPVNVEHLVHM
uniref:GDSL esterase/lipase At5g55050-like n=1 Tax=Erigeron canadensis TaxID=72917 RepID=UPI001CB8D864|nr:GDSL esterase/lipase At5g55050-like [Erigeron canadensis]